MADTTGSEIGDSMRAMRFDVESKTLALRTVPVPEAGHGEVLVRVHAAGVCLSDVHIAQGLITPRHILTGEVTLGHEVAGVVARIGEGVTGWTVGDRVVLQPLVWRPDGSRTLGVDYDGGWAEYVVTPASTLVTIPDDLCFEEAAIIPDAVSTPWSAIRTTGHVRAGESVGVWGVGGGLVRMPSSCCAWSVLPPLSRSTRCSLPVIGRWRSVLTRRWTPPLQTSRPS